VPTKAEGQDRLVCAPLAADSSLPIAVGALPV